MKGIARGGAWVLCLAALLALAGCGAGGGPKEPKVEGPVTIRSTPSPVVFATPPAPPL